MSGPAQTGVIAGALLVLSLLLPSAASADIEVPQADGWYRWQTMSVATAADACCHTWSKGVVERCACNLDGRAYGMNIASSAIGDDRLISVYVKMENGSALKIRALDANCAVNTSTRIADLGSIDVADSITWLQAQLRTGPVVAEHAVNAIGAHGGQHGMRALIGVIENRAFDRNLREHALFWLAQSDSDDAFDYLDRLLGQR